MNNIENLESLINLNQLYSSYDAPGLLLSIPEHQASRDDEITINGLRNFEQLNLQSNEITRIENLESLINLVGSLISFQPDNTIARIENKIKDHKIINRPIDLNKNNLCPITHEEFEKNELYYICYTCNHQIKKTSYDIFNNYNIEQNNKNINLCCVCRSEFFNSNEIIIYENIIMMTIEKANVLLNKVINSNKNNVSLKIHKNFKKNKLYYDNQIKKINYNKCKNYNVKQNKYK